MLADTILRQIKLYIVNDAYKMFIDSDVITRVVAWI